MKLLLRRYFWQLGMALEMVVGIAIVFGFVRQTDRAEKLETRVLILEAQKLRVDTVYVVPTPTVK